MIVPIIYVSSFGGTTNLYKQYLSIYLEDFFFESAASYNIHVHDLSMLVQFWNVGSDMLE